VHWQPDIKILLTL